jgi:hypothetical protein
VAFTIDATQRVDDTVGGMELINTLNGSPAPVHLVTNAQGTVYGVLVTADVEASLTR